MIHPGMDVANTIPTKYRGDPHEGTDNIIAHPRTFIFETRVARNGRGAPEEVCPPLKAESGSSGRGDGAPIMFKAEDQSGLPRRLTPRECERLHGFPDDWTRWNDEGVEQADTPRYRALGNAVSPPVAAWIGARILKYSRGLG